MSAEGRGPLTGEGDHRAADVPGAFGHRIERIERGARTRAERNHGMKVPDNGLMILIAGPYRSGTGDDPEKMAANVRAMEAHALPLFRAGHVPIVGEWLALPLVALAGSRRVGDDAFDEVFHPIAERLLERCDGVLRVGGASTGADLMVDLARKRGLRVFQTLGEVPGCV